MNPCRLSIVIITMNRQEQVINALQSCVKCKLPAESVFVIIDNDSVDDTENEIKRFFIQHSDINYIYKKTDSNVGAGMGRNIGFELTNSKFVFFLDDDVIIDEHDVEIFFLKALEMMEQNPSFATLTTQIYDEALNGIREVRISKSNRDRKNFDSILLIHGGSCFFRRSAYDGTIFPNIKYGFEELYSSILAIDNGYINAYTNELKVIHQPRINKWSSGSKLLSDVTIKGNAGLLTVKYLLFPRIFYPLLFAAFFARWFKYLRNEKGSLKKSYGLFRQQKDDNISLNKKITSSTVLRIFREFGFGAGV